MSYPVMSKAEARAALHAPDAAAAVPRSSDAGAEVDWDELAERLSSELLNLVRVHAATGKVDGKAFESAAAPLVHRLLPRHPALSDAEFWLWLAVYHGRDVVRERYADRPTVDDANYGVGGAGEHLLYRLWLRAEIAVDAAGADPYFLVRAGDIDFWRSHVFRQGYGDVRHFARALVHFQFQAGADPKRRLSVVGIRELAKRLRRARSNLAFELMSDDRAYRFIEGEWARGAGEEG